MRRVQSLRAPCSACSCSRRRSARSSCWMAAAGGTHTRTVRLLARGPPCIIPSPSTTHHTAWPAFSMPVIVMSFSAARMMGVTSACRGWGTVATEARA